MVLWSLVAVVAVAALADALYCIIFHDGWSFDSTEEEMDYRRLRAEQRKQELEYKILEGKVEGSKED